MNEVVRGLARGKPLARAWTEALERSPQPVRLEMGEGFPVAHGPEGRHPYDPARLPEGLRHRLSNRHGLAVVTVYLDAHDRELLRRAATRGPR